MPTLRILTGDVLRKMRRQPFPSTNAPDLDCPFAVMLNWDRLVKRKIAQAQQEGKFADLPGFGRPIENLDEGWDETRWMREKLRAENLRVMPPAWALRQWAAQETARLAAIEDEGDLRRQIETFNAELRDRMRRVLWGPPVDVALIDVEAFIASRRARVAPLSDSENA